MMEGTWALAPDHLGLFGVKGPQASVLLHDPGFLALPGEVSGVLAGGRVPSPPPAARAQACLVSPEFKLHEGGGLSCPLCPSFYLEGCARRRADIPPILVE